MSAVAKLARRALLGRVLGGAAMAPLLPHMAARAAADNIVALTVPMDGASNVTWRLSVPGERLSRFCDEASASRREIERAAMHRLGGLEPDLASLQSVSYARKATMQRQRDRAAYEANESWLAGLRRSLGIEDQG